MTHKTWPPPVGTLLILTDAAGAAVDRSWASGDVLVVVDDRNSLNPRVTRVRDHSADEYWMFDRCCRPVEEDDNDQT